MLLSAASGHLCSFFSKEFFCSLLSLSLFFHFYASHASSSLSRDKSEIIRLYILRRIFYLIFLLLLLVLLRMSGFSLFIPFFNLDMCVRYIILTHKYTLHCIRVDRQKLIGIKLNLIVIF